VGIADSPPAGDSGRRGWDDEATGATEHGLRMADKTLGRIMPGTEAGCVGVRLGKDGIEFAESRDGRAIGDFRRRYRRWTRVWPARRMPSRNEACSLSLTVAPGWVGAHERRVAESNSLLL